MTNGQETNFPNTIDNCTDGSVGAYTIDESIDRIRISTNNGQRFAPNSKVTIDATMWPWIDGAEDFLDFYYAPNSSSGWIYIGTERPFGTGEQVVSKTFNLDSGSSELQAIRVHLRWDQYGGPGKQDGCSASPYDDVDDLIFTVDISQ